METICFVCRGATETIALAPATSVSQYSYNNLNELTAIAAGGATKFEATTNKALKSATVNSNPATLNWTKNFTGNASLSNGTNTVPVGATDGANNTVTNNYQVAATGPSSSTQTHDANGNMTSDGTNSYTWDAENRLIKITYPGSGNFSDFLYDANGYKGQITETVASALTSTKQFVNSGSRIREERDASSAVTKKFFGRGQTISGSNYFYAFDHLESIRDMTDTSGVVQAHYEYDQFGKTTKTAGALDSDFRYASYYMHASSELYMTVFRAYDSKLGRFVNRDPISEAGGINLYAYVRNMVTTSSDPTGTDRVTRVLPRQTDRYVRMGCNGLCGREQGQGLIQPEIADNTHCFLHKAEADAYKCPCNSRPFVFGIQGSNSNGPPMPDATGEVPTDSISTDGTSPFNYQSPVRGSSAYQGLNHAATDRNGNEQSQTHWRGDPMPVSEVYPNEIWCVTCGG